MAPTSDSGDEKGQRMTDYNYDDFVMEREEPSFQAFPGNLTAGERAPGFPLEDLASGETVELQSLWAEGLAVVEFGSFT